MKEKDLMLQNTVICMPWN